MQAAISGALPFLKNQAESRMIDVCRIVRSSGTPTFDPATGEYDIPDPTTVYTGKCRVKAATFRALEVEAGEDTAFVIQFLVSLPLTATGIQVRDVLTVTASGDSDEVGMVLQVDDVPRGAQMTARRLVCKEFPR